MWEEILLAALKQFAVIAVGGVCGYLVTKIKAKEQEIKDQEKRSCLGRQADRVMLRNTIRQACKKRIKEGWVELDEKSDILACYSIYEEIIKQEGITNGVIEDIVKQYRTLPNVPPKE